MAALWALPVFQIFKFEDPLRGEAFPNGHRQTLLVVESKGVEHDMDVCT